MGKHSWDWFVLLINIPISIGIGLLIPKIQKFLEDRGKSSHEKKLSRQKDEYEDAIYYALHTDLLLGRMIHFVMWMAIAIVSIIATSTYVSPIIDVALNLFGPAHGPQMSPSFHFWSGVFVLIGLVVFISGAAITIATQVKNINELFSHVHFFRSFVETIPDELRNKQREEFVMNARWDRSVPGAERNVAYITELVRQIKDEAGIDKLTNDLAGNDAAAAPGKSEGTPDTPSSPQK